MGPAVQKSEDLESESGRVVFFGLCLALLLEAQNQCSGIRTWSLGVFLRCAGCQILGQIYGYFILFWGAFLLDALGWAGRCEVFMAYFCYHAQGCWPDWEGFAEWASNVCAS